MRRFRTSLLPLALAACASAPPPIVVPGGPFDSAQVAFLAQPGTNKIEGQAFMRQNGGGVVTCAASDVNLVPRTRYAERRMVAVYGSTAGGSLPIGAALRADDSAVDPAYKAAVLTAKCDAAGEFLFERVPDGDYFLAATVAWQVLNGAEGAVLMEPVSVRGGETARVLLSR